MKTRLLGAAVVIALAVLFVPMFFSSSPPRAGGDQAVSLAIPPTPDRELQTRTMSLKPDSPAGSSTSNASPTGAVTPGSSDQLARVDIGSQRPRDVENDPQAGKAPTPTTVKIGSGDSATQPVIPQRIKPEVNQPKVAAATPDASKPAPVPVSKPTPSEPTVGHGSYSLNLSAYASAAGAAKLQRRVRALGYPVTGHTITHAGKTQTLLVAGPFDTRAAAEIARLKITQSIPGAPARLEQDASRDDTASQQTAGKPAARSGSSEAGGYAVQLAAVSSHSDANALRDKLRSHGFDGFVDSVQSSGKTLWRVRAGPQTQRSDAQRVHDQIKSRLGIDGNVVSVP